MWGWVGRRRGRGWTKTLLGLGRLGWELRGKGRSVGSFAEDVPGAAAFGAIGVAGDVTRRGLGWEGLGGFPPLLRGCLHTLCFSSGVEGWVLDEIVRTVCTHVGRCIVGVVHCKHGISRS